MNYRKLVNVLRRYPNTTKFDYCSTANVFNYYGKCNVPGNYYARIKYNNIWIVSYHPTSIMLCLLELLDKLLLQEEV